MMVMMIMTTVLVVVVLVAGDKGGGEASDGPTPSNPSLGSLRSPPSPQESVRKPQFACHSEEPQATRNLALP